MSTLHMNLMPASGLARKAPEAIEFPPAFRQFLQELAQVIKGSVVGIAPTADLDGALRRDLGLD
jgi:hypothetical protein